MLYILDICYSDPILFSTKEDAEDFIKQLNKKLQEHNDLLAPNEYSIYPLELVNNFEEWWVKNANFYI